MEPATSGYGVSSNLEEARVSLLAGVRNDY